MNITPAFVISAVVCVVPFGLAIRQDLQHKDGVGMRGDWEDEYRSGLDDYGRDDSAEIDYEALLAAERERALLDEEPELESRAIKSADLATLVGAEPATLGPLFAGVAIGASSQTFLPDSTREQIEAWKLEHELETEFDFDDVTLNGVTLRASGEELVLRDAMISLWGTPRRLGEDELVWVGAGSQRAVYSAMYDGFSLRFERYATIEELIAPADKKKLGLEPYPLLGTKLAKLEQALGGKLQDSGYESERSWALPGIGNGSGKTMVRIGLDTDDRITDVLVEGSTADGDAVRDALVAKWGMPKEDDDGTLTWITGKSEITAAFYDAGFELRQTRR